MQSASLYCDTSSMDISLQDGPALAGLQEQMMEKRCLLQFTGGNFIETANMTQEIAYPIPGTAQTGKLDVKCNTGKAALNIYTEGTDT